MSADDATKPILSIGIIIDPPPLQAWVCELIEQVLEKDLARLVYVAAAPRGRTRLDAIKDLPQRLYMLLDRFLFPCAAPAFEQLDDGALTDRLPMFDLGRAHQLPPGRDLDEVEVVINLSSRVLADVLSTRAPQRVWSLPALTQGRRDLQAVYERRPVVTVTLEEVSPSASDDLELQQAHCATDFFSVGRTRNRAFWKGAALVVRALQRSCASAAGAPEREQVRTAERPVADGHSVSLLLAKITGRLLREGIDRLLFRRRWLLMARAAAAFSDDFGSYRQLVPPRGCAWADPCVVSSGGRHFAFIEQILSGRQNGHLAVTEMKSEAMVAPPEVILEKPYHLSHPFVFEWQGNHYLIPESVANHSVDLYRCVDFPTRWEFCSSLMSGVRAVDATLLEHAGRWWMFATIAAHKGATTRDELFLFSNHRPIDDQWEPHPLNPIVTDARRARPAGRIHRREGKLVRPAQDCSHRYGYGIRMMEIVALDGERYEEVEVASYAPWAPNIVGMHTIDLEAGFTMLDAKRRTVRFLNR